MAQITINEISQNYTYNIGTSSFCTVALPITSCWGPGYFPKRSEDSSGAQPVGTNAPNPIEDTDIEDIVWQRFEATQAGLEKFVAAYRGPAANYRAAKDMSYQMAMTLLTAGYDILVCRAACGDTATSETSYTITDGNAFGNMFIVAKYPGSFGNSIGVKLNPVKGYDSAGNQVNKYWNLIVYAYDTSGVRTAVENLVFTFNLDNSTDSIPHVSELESNFVVISGYERINSDNVTFGAFPNVDTILMLGNVAKGTDILAYVGDDEWGRIQAQNLAKSRYTATWGQSYEVDKNPYISAYNQGGLGRQLGHILLYNEWRYNAAYILYDMLVDKLAYNPNRIISPGWDDQNISDINGSDTCLLNDISPLHKKIMDVSYASRCATGMLDIPKCLPRSAVHDTTETNGIVAGYAQKLARQTPSSTVDANGSLYSTHCSLFAPWGQYQYVGTSKKMQAPPSFLALMIMRAMILNQSLQYEWAMPSNRKHNLSIGKLDYKVPKKLLDKWQTLEGVGVNVITEVPDLGTTLWGNSTLYEVPPATYQALANLSTRFLVNAVENVVYKTGISITFNYNNDDAYSKFYAAVTPILDTMKQAGAIDGYYVKMAADINGLDQVNANTVIGKVYLVVNGIINDIVVDLVALPPGTDLTQFQS